MALPDLLTLKPRQLKDLYDEGELSKYSIGYLESINLYHPAIWGKSLGQALDGSIVWLPQDTTGRLPIIEENSSTIQQYQTYLEQYGRLDQRPTTKGTASINMTSDRNTKLVRKITTVSFASNAGGAIDSDPELVAATSGYYGVFRIKKIKCEDATTPIFDINDGTLGNLINLSPGTLGAHVVSDKLDMVIYSGSDNSALTIDGSGCSGLGASKEYVLEVESWLET